MNDDTVKFLAELEQAEALVSEQNECVVPAGERPCPICGEPMEVEDYPCGPIDYVQMDVCDRHGVWLDCGELPKIISCTKLAASDRRIREIKRAKLEGKKAGYMVGAWAFLLD